MTTMNDEITVIPVTDAPWDDVRTIFGTRGDPSTCWCQFFKQPYSEFSRTSAEEKCGLLERQVSADGPAPGVVAYLNGEPVGWCAVEQRIHYGRLRTTKVVSQGSQEDWDDPTVWAVTCFVVRVGHRKRGVSRALLDGAIEHARSNGARIIEGYPVDVQARAKVSAAELYYGPLSLFEKAGFEIVARPTSGRAVVVLKG